jgi:hypothetical protein
LNKMVKIRLGINSSFGHRRWIKPKEWMELIFNELHLKICELSLDQIDPLLQEPTKTAYMQEIRELGDQCPLEILSCRTGENINNNDMLLHPNFGNRMDSVHWYEKAIDIAAYTNVEYFGGYFGGFVRKEHTDPKSINYVKSFLVDSLEYLASIAYTAGLKGMFFEPFSLYNDTDSNIQLNREILDGVETKQNFSLNISPNAADLHIERWISEFQNDFHLIQLNNIKEARKIHSLLNGIVMDKKFVIAIYKPDLMIHVHADQYFAEIKKQVNEIRNIFA